MRRMIAFVLLLALCAGAPAAVAESMLAVTFFDVGQGDAALLQCDGQTMLIDTGLSRSSGKLLQYLVQLGVTSFDYVVCTHPHGDHVGGLSSVLQVFYASRIFLTDAPYASGSSCYEYAMMLADRNRLTMEVPPAGSVYMLGGATVSVLAPNSRDYDAEGDWSLVLRVDHGENSFLFMGDAGIASEAEMIAAGYPLNADVIKVGDHGFATASSLPFLRAVSPQWAIISCQPQASYFEPSGDVLASLETVGATVLRTDEKGPITIFSDGATLTLQGIKQH